MLKTVTVMVLAVAAVGLTAWRAAAEPVRVRNPETPSDGQTTINTREMWRAGAGEDGPLFGVIVQALTDEEGTIYLLDKQQSTVWTYASDGRYLGSLLREGEGPGEIRRPEDMALLPDGTLGVCSAHSGQLVRVNDAGIPGESIQIGGPEANRGEMVWLDGVASRAGSLVFLCQEILHNSEKQTTNYYLARADGEGRETCRYFEKSVVDDFADFTINETNYYYPKGRLWTIGPDGRVYLVPERNDYRIHVHAEDGTLERIIECEFRPVQRNRREKEATRNAYEEWYGSLSPSIELEDTEPAITRLMVDEKGFLWVLTSRGVRDRPDGIMAAYDVFDTGGRFVRRIEVACAGDGRFDDLFFLGDDRLLLITGAYEAAMALRGIPLVRDETAEPGPMEIICLERAN
jgi:hypothetical protein